MAMDDDEYAGRRVNKKARLITDPRRYPDEYYVEVMDSLYIPANQNLNGMVSFDVTKLNFKYSWWDEQGYINDSSRSEERRVGKECRYRGRAYESKKNRMHWWPYGS